MPWRRAGSVCGLCVVRPPVTASSSVEDRWSAAFQPRTLTLTTFGAGAGAAAGAAPPPPPPPPIIIIIIGSIIWLDELFWLLATFLMESESCVIISCICVSLSVLVAATRAAPPQTRSSS